MKKYVVGIDIGGTNIKLGLVNSSGKVVARTRLMTKTFKRNRTKLIDALVVKINDLIKGNKLFKKEILGIGIGFPGLINPQSGIVKFAPNIPGWKQVPIKKIIQKKLRLPTFIDNDVNLVTLGEWKFGAGKGYKNLVCITLGTGVGGGLILEDALYRGEGFVAGEIGHIPINEKGPQCNCGGWGCFERYVGNRFLSQKAGRIFKRKNMIPPDITALARKGNKKAIKLWEETGVHIGNALTGVINLLNPRMVIIGGGVSNNLHFMKKSINTVIRKRAMGVQAKMVKIVRARLGDDAGIIGAYVLVKEGLIDQ